MLLRILLISSLFIAFKVYAHSGNTNSAGCHNNHKTGGYHCHNSKSSSSSSVNSNSSSSNNNNNNTTSSDIKIEAPGTYPTGFENVVYKNARCSGYWKVDLVNRNNKLVYYKAAFFTVDQDGDPLKTQLLGLNGWLKLFQSSRSTIDLDIFDCSINFEELQASFEIYSP